VKTTLSAAYCQGPDPIPKLPALHAPQFTTDTHFHIFGPEEDYAYAAEREYTPPDAPPGAYRNLASVLGVQRAVLVQPSVYNTDNSRMLGAASELGIPTRMVAVLPVQITDAELHVLHNLGVRAVRFILAHPGGLPPIEAVRFAARIKELGWHLQFLLRPADLIELEPVLTRLPIDFVVDHIGLIRASDGGTKQPAFRSLLRLFDKGRCWIKLTGGYRISAKQSPYRDVIPLVRALCNVRADKLLWGTDWPHVMVKSKMPNTTELLDLLLEWVPDEKMRNRILVDNPATLFGF
jgi:predicted TIM-barrel fold metal-dependent hydrolase